MSRLWAWLIGPDFEVREATWAWRQINARVQADLAAGRVKPPRVIYKTADKRKTHIGFMRQRILRGEFRRRA